MAASLNTLFLTSVRGVAVMLADRGMQRQRNNITYYYFASSGFLSQSGMRP